MTGMRMDDRTKHFGIKMPRRTLDWLALTLACAKTALFLVMFGLLYSVAEATSLPASDVPLRLTDIVILLSIGAQTAAIAFFAGGLAARVAAIEEWRKEHIEWSQNVVDKNQEAHDEIRRGRP